MDADPNSNKRRRSSDTETAACDSDSSQQQHSHVSVPDSSSEECTPPPEEAAEEDDDDVISVIVIDSDDFEESDEDEDEVEFIPLLDAKPAAAASAAKPRVPSARRRDSLVGSQHKLTSDKDRDVLNVYVDAGCADKWPQGLQMVGGGWCAHTFGQPGWFNFSALLVGAAGYAADSTFAELGAIWVGCQKLLAAINSELLDASSCKIAMHSDSQSAIRCLMKDAQQQGKNSAKYRYLVTKIKELLRQLTRHLPMCLLWVKGHQKGTTTEHALGNWEADSRAKHALVTEAWPLPLDAACAAVALSTEFARSLVRRVHDEAAARLKAKKANKGLKQALGVKQGVQKVKGVKQGSVQRVTGARKGASRKAGVKQGYADLVEAELAQLLQEQPPPPPAPPAWQLLQGQPPPPPARQPTPLAVQPPLRPGGPPAPLAMQPPPPAPRALQPPPPAPAAAGALGAEDNAWQCRMQLRAQVQYQAIEQQRALQYNSRAAAAGLTPAQQAVQQVTDTWLAQGGAAACTATGSVPEWVQQLRCQFTEHAEGFFSAAPVPQPPLPAAAAAGGDEGTAAEAVAQAAAAALKGLLEQPPARAAGPAAVQPNMQQVGPAASLAAAAAARLAVGTGMQAPLAAAAQATPGAGRTSVGARGAADTPAPVIDLTESPGPAAAADAGGSRRSSAGAGCAAATADDVEVIYIDC